MKKEHIQPKVTLYDVTAETNILSSSNVDWGMGGTPSTDGGIIEEDEDFEMG